MWKILFSIPELLTGLVGYLNKKQDVSLEKYRVDGQIDQTLIQAEIALVQARASVFDHLTWIHKGFGAVTLLYYTAILWDAATEDLFPNLHWDVQPLGGWAASTAAMIIAFFFLHAAIGKYRR